MKKRALLCCCLCICLLTGCAKSDTVGNQAAADEIANTDTDISEIETSIETKEADEGIYEIKEDMFITQCNDIYLNPDDYLDKMIKIEGLYYNMEDTEEGIIRHYVIRYGPACCVDDSSAGFEIRYDGEYPEINDWIIVTASIEKIKRNGNDFVALNVISFEVSEERGAEQVLN